MLGIVGGEGEGSVEWVEEEGERGIDTKRIAATAHHSRKTRYTQAHELTGP